MTYYTIYLGDVLWENVVDDMNSSDIWGTGGMVWREKKKALACIKHLRNPAFGFEEKGKRFHVVILHESQRH